MLGLAAYQGLPFVDQLMHELHFILCVFAVLIAIIPLLADKGSDTHKKGGRLYIPVSVAAFCLASVLAYLEQSLLLVCFNVFCAYLLLSGWRAIREKQQPSFFDWFLPGGLVVLASFVVLHALFDDEGIRSFYLLFFAFNAYCLAWRDFQHLKVRSYWVQHRKFFPDVYFAGAKENDWLGRHIAGMAGSAIANLSVVVLTLLPLGFHWLWPAGLLLISVLISVKRLFRKRALDNAMAPLRRNVKKASRAPSAEVEDLRKAA